MRLTRRSFLKTNSLASLALTSGTSLSPLFAKQEHSFLRIKPRYYRWHVDEGQEWTEKNTRYATLDWKIPLTQCAVVLVDVWQRHYLREPEERAEKIIDEKLVPLMRACREKGLEIIHAPASEAAKIHPNWVRIVTDQQPKHEPDPWPPRAFRNLSGEFDSYRRPVEPREAERQRLPPLRIHPKAEPLASEVVVATGEELHQYCKNRGILFLFFAGFNTNACILSRDYGTLEMSKRGYQVLLVRDCTTGMESFESQETLAQTHGAILQLEMFGQYTVTSDEIREGLS